MKKAFLLALGLLCAAPAHAARDWYFSNSVGGLIAIVGSDSNLCTQLSPCLDPTTKIGGVGGVSPGDNVILDQDTFLVTGIWLLSNGTALSRCTLKGIAGPGYAKVTSMQAYPSGWVNFSGEVWYHGGISWTDFHIYAVMKGLDPITGVGLFKWGESYGSNTIGTMPRDHFWFEASTDRIYVRLPNGENPNTTGDMYLPATTTAPSFNGTRGIICTGCENGTVGDYWDLDMTYIRIVGSNGMGISIGGNHNRILYRDSDLDDNNIINGCGKDCLLGYQGQVSGEEASDWIVDGVVTAYGALAGTGHGQSWTTYALRTLWVNVGCRNSGMACFDFLQGFDSPSDASNGALKNFFVDGYGLWGDSRSFDPAIYWDGASFQTAMNGTVTGGGTGNNGPGQANDHPGFKFGSEHPNTDPTTNVDVVNVLAYNIHAYIFYTDNIPDFSNNIGPIRIYHATAVARRNAAGGNDNQIFTTDQLASFTGAWSMKNSILVGESDFPLNNYIGTDSRFSQDYNLFYRDGGNTTIFRNSNGTNYTLATWRTASGLDGQAEDLHSLNVNPLFVTDTQGAYDLHLQQIASGQAANSPAVDTGTPGVYACQSYLFSQWPTYFPECAPGGTTVTGSTRTDGVLDNMNAAPDMGYHWAAGSEVPDVPPAGPGTITLASVTHTSALTGTAGTLTPAGTIEHALPSDGQFQMTVDPDYTFDSGGTSAFSCTVGCDGALTLVSNVANLVTLRRSSTADAPVPAVLDAFTRANTGPPGSASWTTKNGDGWKVVSNKLQSQTTSAGWSNDYWNAASYQDVDASIDIDTKPASGGNMAIQVRWDTALDKSYSVALWPGSGTDQIKIQYYDGTAQNTLALYNQEVSTGDSIRISVYGNALRAYYKPSGGSWRALGAAVTDNNLTAAGRVGLFTTNSSTVIVDNFLAGSISAAPTASGATDTAAGTAIAIGATNVQTPQIVQTTDTSTLSTLTSDGSIIDTVASLTGSSFIAPAPPVGVVPSNLQGSHTFSGSNAFRKDS